MAFFAIHFLDRLVDHLVAVYLGSFLDLFGLLRSDSLDDFLVDTHAIGDVVIGRLKFIRAFGDHIGGAV